MCLDERNDPAPRRTAADLQPVRRILLVENEFLLADDLRRRLEACGVAVVGPCATSRDALLKLREAAPVDGAVLDVGLKGETSFAIADELGRLEIPYVFATGFDASSLPSRYEGRPVLQKPVEAAELLGLLAAPRLRPSSERT